MEGSNGTSCIWTALAEAQKAMEQPALDGTGRAGKNGCRTYKYATLASVRKAVMPPCNERGVFLTQHFDGGNALVTEAHMGAESAVLDRRAVGLTGRPQEDGSAETYAKRYALCSVFCLAGIEDDDGKAATEASGANQPATSGAPRPFVAQCRGCGARYQFESAEQMGRSQCTNCGGTVFEAV